MNSTMSIRVRLARFLDERYSQRAHPHYFPELAVFGLIVLMAIWPIFSLAAAMQIVR